MEMIRLLKSTLIALSLHLSTISRGSNRDQRNSSTKVRIEMFLLGRTRSGPETSAASREEGPPKDSSAESLVASNCKPRPTAKVLHQELRKAFSDKPRLFPKYFGWACECGLSGFPGCDDLEHFCQRVYVAILDYHQLEGSQRRGLA